MRRLLTIVLLLACPATVSASTLTESTAYRPQAVDYWFSSTAEDTAQIMPHYLQLPASVQPGDIVMVNAREEFTNPTWGSPGAWTVGGSVSEHWSTPIMGACGIKRGITPGAATSGSWIAPQTAENFDGIVHHWTYDASEDYIATAADAGGYLAVVCYFSRALAYRQVANDYVHAETAPGKLEAAVIAP